MPNCVYDTLRVVLDAHQELRNIMASEKARKHSAYVVLEVVKDYLRQDLPQVHSRLTYGMTAEEKRLADDTGVFNDQLGYYVGSKKIEAIKMVRVRTNLALKDAKDLVEAYQNKDGGETARRLGLK